MFIRICLSLFLVIQLSYFSFAAAPDKKTNTLQLINTLTELPFFKVENGFAEYLAPFYMPVHVYIEDGDKSIVELRSVEQELLYRVEISYLNNYPDKLVIYRSEKISVNNADEQSPYKVIKYLDHMEVVYKEGKLSTLTYAYDEEDEPNKLLIEYNPNKTLKRAYFDSVQYGGSYFEAKFSGQYADSIIIFLCNKEKKLIPYSTYISKHNNKGNLTERIIYPREKGYSTVHSAKYDTLGNLIELCKNVIDLESYRCKQYCTVYEYTSEKISKAVEYYDIGSKDSNYAEKVKQPDYITGVYYYTFNAAGAMLTRRNFFQNYCMDTDITLVCTLDSKNMVIEKKLVHKSKSKCRY